MKNFGLFVDTWKFCGESGAWTSFKRAFKSHLYEVFKQWILCHYNYDLSLLVPNMRWNWVGNALPIITGHTLECFSHYFNLESGGGYVLPCSVFPWSRSFDIDLQNKVSSNASWLNIGSISSLYCLLIWIATLWDGLWLPNSEKIQEISSNCPMIMTKIQQFTNNLQSQNWYKCHAKA